MPSWRHVVFRHDYTHNSMPIGEGQKGLKYFSENHSRHELPWGGGRTTYFCDPGSELRLLDEKERKDKDYFRLYGKQQTM